MGAGIFRPLKRSQYKRNFVTLIEEPSMTVGKEPKVLTLPIPPTEVCCEDDPVVDEISQGLTEKNDSLNLEENTDAVNRNDVTDSSSKITDLKDIEKYNLTTLISVAVNLVTNAVTADKNHSYRIAHGFYQKAIKYFTYALAHKEASVSVREVLQGKLRYYIDRSDQIGKFLMNKQSENTDEGNLMDQIKSAVVEERPTMRWSDVAGLEGAKGVLKEALILPIKFPHIMSGKRKPWKGILLFGHFGTGKSMLVRVATSEANTHTVFSVTPSSLMAKWIGESEKLAKLLFELARERKPSLIFIDEVDCFNVPDPDKNATIIRMKTEFLLQMKRLNIDNDEIVVLGATNKPWTLDDTLIRWFEKKVYIPLPDEEARLSILKMSFGNTPHSLNDDDFKILAKKTDMYSGSDIDTLVRDAIMQPVRKIQAATHFIKVSGPSSTDSSIIVEDLVTPCSPSERGAIEMSWMNIPEDKLLIPAVTMNDLLHCLANSKPSITEEDLLQMKKFLENFGHGS